MKIEIFLPLIRVRSCPFVPNSSLRLHDLFDLQLRDRSWIQIDALLESPRETAFIERDDPALLDDHVLDHPSIRQLRAANREILSLGNTISDEHVTPLLRENLGEPIARGDFRMHGGSGGCEGGHAEADEQ
jgi:hypothetical protein